MSAARKAMRDAMRQHGQSIPMPYRRPLHRITLDIHEKPDGNMHIAADAPNVPIDMLCMCLETALIAAQTERDKQRGKVSTYGGLPLAMQSQSEPQKAG